jgi:hypothetical protein
MRCRFPEKQRGRCIGAACVYWVLDGLEASGGVEPLTWQENTRKKINPTERHATIKLGIGAPPQSPFSAFGAFNYAATCSF